MATLTLVKGADGRHDANAQEKNDIGYLVKWKGYDAEHNSYVKTDDIGYVSMKTKHYDAS